MENVIFWEIIQTWDWSEKKQNKRQNTVVY